MRRCGRAQRTRTPSFRGWAQDLLALEKGTLHLRQGAPVRIALVYPNTYEVGMASLGFQTVYRLFNQTEDVLCERFFALNEPGEALALESGDPLGRYDLVGISLSFEQDISHLIRFLRMGGLSPLSGNRTGKDPIVLCGGVVTGLNPSPLLPFVDGLLVGEAEDLIQPIAEILLENRPRFTHRSKRLEMLSRLDGIFVPGIVDSVNRRILHSLEEHPTYTPIVTPASHFEDMFVVEVGRGCMRSCKFCAGQKVYSPYRFRSASELTETIAKHNPGAHRIGLEGAGISDFPGLNILCETLVKTGYAISISSLRADRVSEDLLQCLAAGGLRTFTMAPEAGSEKLRKKIGKQMPESAILKAAHDLSRTTIGTLKLYFLIGLPGEEDEDVEDIGKMVREIRKILHSRIRIRLSVNAFIPKPFTEFQWAPMNRENELQGKRRKIQDAVRGLHGVDSVSRRASEEVFQGILSVGGIEVGMAVLDQTEGKEWKRALKDRGVDPGFIFKERDYDMLPWSMIRAEGIHEQLKRAYTKYRRGSMKDGSEAKRSKK